MMTENQKRAYIKELSSKPAFWIKEASGGYFDIESFGLALIEVFAKAAIEEYKASLVPVACMRDDGMVNGNILNKRSLEVLLATPPILAEEVGYNPLVGEDK